MTIIAALKELAADVGLDIPLIGLSSQSREVVELVSFANAVGLEIAGRAAWGGLTKQATITGDGTANPRTLPADALFLVDGVTIIRSDGESVRPLTRAEWNIPPVMGLPRYFLKEGLSLRLYPHLANAATVTVPYQSRNWVSNGTDKLAADTDTTVFPEDALLKGLIARWRRQKGMPYQDYEAEYEATLTRYGAFDDRSRL
jgi:hypothetical protein